MFLGKHFAGEYYWKNYDNNGQSIHLEDKLNKFYEEHLFCTKPLKNNGYCDTPYSDDYGWDTIFEIAYEFDNCTKHDYSGEYREEMTEYGDELKDAEKTD